MNEKLKLYTGMELDLKIGGRTMVAGKIIGVEVINETEIEATVMMANDNIMVVTCRPENLI